MYILIAIPRTGGQPMRVTESSNLAELTASKVKLQEAHTKYQKQAEELNKVQPITFEQYEGTQEEYDNYLQELQKEVFVQGRDVTLGKPCYLNCDLFIL